MVADKSSNETALMFACCTFRSHASAVKELIHLGAEVNEVDRFGRTALDNLAAFERFSKNTEVGTRKKIVIVLLKAGPSFGPKSGNTY